MVAYVVATEQVTDEATFGRYTKLVPETIEPFGGRLVVWRSHPRAKDARPQLGVIEFPSRRQAKSWFRSAAYRRALSLRIGSSTGDIVITTGIDGLRRALQASCRVTMTLR
jgi:uncharacterized protein (DUF1330 family)